jgi:hypothetical protein
MAERGPPGTRAEGPMRGVVTSTSGPKLEQYSVQHLILDPQEGSCDRTPFEPEERKKDQLWHLSANCPRVFGYPEHLAVLV